MKKVLSAVLAVLMLVSLFALSGCGKAEELKMGMGISAVYGSNTEADGETDGVVELDATAAAVLLDGEGKIVQCVMDTVQTKPSYTSTGKAVAITDLRTKAEKGPDYGMAAYGTDLNEDGVVKEWNEQAAAFIATIEGKTIDEVKAMVVDGYGNEEIQTAGCTIHVNDFVAAVEKAVANAVETSATAEDTLQLGIVSVQEPTDATEEKDGVNQVDSTFVAAVVDKDGKVVAAATDVLQGKVSFDTKGVLKTDLTVAMKTKVELGTDYGMAAYGTDRNEDGVVKEWNEQGAAFDAALIGKTAAEIGELVVDDYGVESLQTAGCTIHVTDMVAAAVKAATVA